MARILICVTLRYVCVSARILNCVTLRYVCVFFKVFLRGIWGLGRGKIQQFSGKVRRKHATRINKNLTRVCGHHIY